MDWYRSRSLTSLPGVVMTQSAAASLHRSGAQRSVQGIALRLLLADAVASFLQTRCRCDPPWVQLPKRPKRRMLSLAHSMAAERRRAARTAWSRHRMTFVGINTVMQAAKGDTHARMPSKEVWK
jgi:hypothetical protein